MCPDKLNELFARIASRPSVAMPDEETGLIFERDSWRLFSLTNLWADEPNTRGDLILVSPGGRTLHASWDVVANAAPSVEIFDDPNLQLRFNLDRAIQSWEELASAVLKLLPEVARHYSEAAPSTTAPEPP
jgi:hypothetical protein